MRTCLVVDDSRVIRKVSRHILESLDFTVEEAENGRKALSAAAIRMPDLVVTDWDMPVMDGIAFVRELRRAPGGDKAMSCTACNTKGMEQLAWTAAIKLASVNGTRSVGKSSQAKGNASCDRLENTTRCKHSPRYRR